MAQNEKELKVFQVKIVERVSSKGKPYKVICAVVNGENKSIGFLTEEIEFALYKAGIKL